MSNDNDIVYLDSEYSVHVDREVVTLSCDHEVLQHLVRALVYSPAFLH